MGVKISEQKSGTKRTKKRESVQAQMYYETTITPSDYEIHTKARFSICRHRHSAQLDFARANITQDAITAPDIFSPENARLDAGLNSKHAKHRK